jgi:hypothetical protein
MTAVLYTIAVLQAIGVLGRLIYLGRGEYPRVFENTAATDAATLVINAGFLVWILWAVL